MTETTLCFLDTETTGLHPELHHVWEVGLIVRRDGEEEQEYLWQLAVDLSTADPSALDIGGFWERRWPEAGDESQIEDSLAGDPQERWAVPLVAREQWCDLFRELTHGAHVVGNVVSFDAERIAALMRWEGRMPTWHYHLVDVECLAAGHLRSLADHVAAVSDGDDERINHANDLLEVATPPWGSDKLSEALGVKVSDESRHTALGDARWARDLFDAVMGRRS